MNRLTRFAKDESGQGAMLALAFALITTAVLSTLGATIAMNGAISTSQRTTEAAEMSVRSVVDAILADINRGMTPAAAVSAHQAPTEFTNTGIAGRVSIASSSVSATTVTLDIKVESTGRIPWTRQGNAEIELAQVVSLARLDEGRAVWDFAPSTGAEEVVALWTAGELSVQVPGEATAAIPAPLPATIALTAEPGAVTYTAAPGGPCTTGWTAQLQTRMKVGRDSDWTRYADAAAGSTASAEAGQQVSVGARIRCVSSDNHTAWAASETTSIIEISDPVPAQPEIEMDGERAKVSVAAAEQPASSITSLQVRTRTGTGAWTEWDDVAAPVFVELPQGYLVEAQSRIRVITDAGDSDWVESPVRSFTRPL